MGEGHRSMSRRERRAMRVLHRRGRVAAAGLGATAMFLLDPERGRRRRALLRDKAVHYRNVVMKSAEVTSRDASNRMQGLRARSDRVMSGDWGALAGGLDGLLKEQWSPTTRAVVGVTGGLLALYGRARRGLTGLVFTLFGGGLVARAVKNVPAGRLTGLGAGRNAVEITKSINVDAPVAEVFALWDDIERFPTFMSTVRRVQRTTGDRSHWEVAGPAGSTVTWDAVTTTREPNRMIAWKTLEGSAVQHTGVVQFDETENGTRVTVRMTYNPVTGALGDMAATLLGADPRRQLDEDLLRMKTLLETGVPAHDSSRQEEDRLSPR